MPRRANGVKPGEWIKVNVTGDPWPITMAVGDAPAQAAFVDHQRSGDQVQTVVQRRCPQLAPGVYTVTVRTPSEVLRSAIRVL